MPLSQEAINQILNEIGVPALEKKKENEYYSLPYYAQAQLTPSVFAANAANLRKEIVSLLQELSTASGTRPAVSNNDFLAVALSNNGSLEQLRNALKSRFDTHVKYWNEEAKKKTAAFARQEAGLSLTSQQQAIIDAAKKPDAAGETAPNQNAAALAQRAKDLSAGLGITYDEALKRIRASDLTEDQSTKELILFRGVEAATGAAPSGAGGGGGGGGYIAPPTTYDFTTIVTPQGGSEIWKRGSDGTLVSTGIKVQQPLQNIGSDRNGNLVGIDPTTNKTVLIQEGYTFPQQDPSVVTVNDRTTGTSYALNTRTGEKRELGTYDFPQISPERTFQENAALSRLGPALSARGQDIQSAQYETDLGTKKFQTIRDILASPTDYVARAFLSQGQAAPGGQITAADLINSLTNIVGAYKVPSPFEQYISRANVAVPISRPAPITPARIPTPTPTPTAAPSAAAPAQTFGGLPLQNLKEMQAKGVPAFAFTPEQQSALGITYTPTALTTPEPPVQTSTPVTGGDIPEVIGGINPNAAVSVANQEYDTLSSERDSPVAPYSWGDPGITSLARGGYINEPAFIVGDSRDGRQTGYEEMIINPTGAPLKVVPNSRLPRFADGSDYREYQRWELRNPTLGEFITDPLIRLPRSGNALADAGIGFVEESTSPLGVALMALGGPVLGKVGGKVVSPLIRRFLPSAANAAETAGVGVPAAAKAARAGQLLLPAPSEAALAARAAQAAKAAGNAGNAARAPLSNIAASAPRIAGYLPERASASVISAPAANFPAEILRADLANFARTPGMFNRLPIALREARSSLIEEARPYTRSEVASLFKRNGVELTDNIWNNIKRIESEIPESGQVMRRGLPRFIEEINLPSATDFIEEINLPSATENIGTTMAPEVSSALTDIRALQAMGIGPESLPSSFPNRLGVYAPPFGQMPAPRGARARRLAGFAEGTGYLPRYAVGSDNVIGAAGSGATGVTPSDVSMGRLSGPAYDWYDAQTGSYGYGAFNPGSPEPTVSGVATPAPAGTLPSVQGAPSTPITQQSIVDMARKWSPPRVSAVLGEQQVGPMQLPVQSASYRQTSNLTPEDVQAFGTRLAAEGTSLTDYSALQKGLFGAKRTSRRGRLVI